MPLWLRRVAIALGGLALLLLGAAAVLLTTFDANRYRALAVDWMKTEHQRTLVIGGPIELSFFPRLAVKVTKVRLSERSRDDEFASIDEAALAVKILPLLSKQLVIGRVAARGVRAAYLRDAQGARNIDDLVSTGAPTPDPGAASSALRWDIGGVQLDDVRLRVRDETANLAGDVVVRSLASGRLAPRAQAPVTLRATAQLSRPYAATLALDGRFTLALDLDRHAVALTGMKLDVDAQHAGADRLSASLEGALGWDGGALRAGPLQVAVKAAMLGTTAVAPSTLEVKRAGFDPAARRLELDALKLNLAGRRGAHAFQLALDWPQLAADAGKLDGTALSGHVKVTGETALEGDFRSAAPAGTFDALRVPGIALKLAGHSGPRKIEAAVLADLVVDLGRRAAAMERIDVRATVADPGVQPLQLALQGRGAAEAKTATWVLAGSIDANRFDTRGRASFVGTVPSLEASARVDSLDLNALLGPRMPAATVPAASAPAETPVQLDALKAVDGQFTLQAGVLAFRQYRVSDAQLAATLDGGMLRLSRITGQAWGGKLQASGSVDAARQRVTVKLDASGVNVNALLKNLADKDLLDGTGHVAADVSSSGASIGALRSNLAGTASIQLRDGAIKGINLARVLRQAQAALSLKQDDIVRASAVEKTDFSELRASARIANGVAHSDDLDVKSPLLRIGGAGRFDIGRGRVDYVARATVVESVTAQGVAGLDALRGVTVPVALTGPFEAIDWKIQWSEVAAAAVRNRLQDKLGEALGARLGLPSARPGAASAPVTPQDAIRERLKRLLK